MLTAVIQYWDSGLGVLILWISIGKDLEQILIFWRCFQCGTTPFLLVKINISRITEMWGYVRLDVASNATSGRKGKEGTGYCIESQLRMPWSNNNEGATIRFRFRRQYKVHRLYWKSWFLMEGNSWYSRGIGSSVNMYCRRAEQMKTNTTVIILERMLIYRI